MYVYVYIYKYIYIYIFSVCEFVKDKCIHLFNKGSRFMMKEWLKLCGNNKR